MRAPRLPALVRVARGRIECGIVACGGAARTSRPGVVLMLVDTLRADHLEAVGHGEDEND